MLYTNKMEDGEDLGVKREKAEEVEEKRKK
jgi:hypothetical protein